MANVGRDEEGVCVSAGDEAADTFVCELVDDALYDSREEITAGTLAEKRADLFIVKKCY